ncbi:putative phosphoribosyl transferase [Thermodesulfobium acidiphilum]|uniref:Putative phosphoribosyl transferase n=1 Tax=Thermodesulfobium acidiphilum TaxID=1794699 RepID=A0A2R4W155_THEAF|nr:phosphoribosyltransferase family protein [Thermodesulfobium acidiphilum]AWB10547.1 putative phosphoribosyl transferase [Thermodesulfobium acidiphilum]PMP84912.1 MAG: phosphoribosyltransferase [Thermodesulfobium narugense]
MFKDRLEAAKLLSEKIKETLPNITDVIVLAIPRGGIVIGAQVAKFFGWDLDITIPRKLGAPGNPELAIGAIGEHNGLVINERAYKLLGIEKDYLDKVIERERKEIERRSNLYRTKKFDYKDKNLIIVDDGIATGSTVIASIRGLRIFKPRSIIVAVPVLPYETIDLIKKEADILIYLIAPKEFWAVGQFYADFGEVKDEEVIRILKEFSEDIKER